jgi:hypothetical protein
VDAPHQGARTLFSRIDLPHLLLPHLGLTMYHCLCLLVMPPQVPTAGGSSVGAAVCFSGGERRFTFAMHCGAVRQLQWVESMSTLVSTGTDR